MNPSLLLDPFRITVGITIAVLLGSLARVAWVAMRDKDRSEEDGWVSGDTLARVRGVEHDRTDG